MYQSRLFFIATLAVIASGAFLISVSFQYPGAISSPKLLFIIALECFAIFNLFKMNEIICKEKSQTNKTNEEIQ